MKKIIYLLLFTITLFVPTTMYALDFTTGDVAATVDTARTRGVTAGDFNGDDVPDIYVVNNNNQPNQVWLSDGAGDYTELQIAGDTGNTHAAASADFDGDGDIDLYAINASGQQNKLWINDGSGAFVNNDIAGDTNSGYGGDVGDVDGDGDIDIYVATVGTPSQNKLWINDGAGNFVANDIAGDNSNSTDASLVDIDGDDDLDIYVGVFGQNKLWINDGAGNFVANDIAGDTLNTYGVTYGDVDGDGDVDLYAVTQPGQNKLWINDGSGAFVNNDIAGDTGTSATAAFADFDFDDDLDLYVINNGTNRLWINDGAGEFTVDDIAGDTGDAQTVALFDYDGDDSIDIFVGVNASANKLWINNEEAPVVSSSSSRSSGSGIRYVCKDKDASNYNPTRFGRHKDARCKYTVSVEIDKNTNSMNPFKGERCAEGQIISDFMKNGDENGKYSTYNSGVVTQVSILQAHINRLLSDEYAQAAGPVDKWFGIQTKKGVERLQKKLNMLMPNKTPLLIDGIVGPRTQVALNNSCDIDSE